MSASSRIVDEAAAGRLPPWSQPSPQRRAHMERVAALLGEWSAALGLPPAEQARWRAAGLLHDALREVPPDELRPLVAPDLAELEGKLLHGPAAARRLRAEGVGDEPMLLAIAYHTLGHPDLDLLGRALFIADYIEPGRRYDPARLAELRARMPHAANDVLVDVLRARMERLLESGRPIRTETARFWNAVNDSVRSNVTTS